MTYVFIKGHNTAYDYFLTKYFKQGGIPFGGQTSFQEMRKKALDLTQPQVPHEKLLVDYVGAWRFHPESRPSFDFFLARIFDDRNLTQERLEELQSELPLSEGRLILSQEDVAVDLFNFYKRIVREPLRKDIEKGASILKILDYLNVDDSNDLPYSRDVDRRDFEKATRVKSKEVLSWLDTVKTETIASDIALVLQEHSDKGHQMEPMGEPHQDGLRTMRCEHNSKLVQLHCSREPSDSEERWLLQPSRGYGLIERRLEGDNVHRYRVIERTDNKT